MIRIEITIDGAAGNDALDKELAAIGWQRVKDHPRMRSERIYTGAESGGQSGARTWSEVARASTVETTTLKQHEPEIERGPGEAYPGSEPEDPVDVTDLLADQDPVDVTDLLADQAALNAQQEESDAIADGLFKPADTDGIVVQSRVHGQPSAGRKRRTKEEMAEDRAYYGTEDGNPKPPPDFPYAPQTAAQPVHAISTGEERIDPAASAQDAADEARETAQAKAESGKPITRDDLRNVIGKMLAKIGFAKTTAQVVELLGQPMIEVPEAEIPGAIAKVEAWLAGAPVSVAEAAKAAAAEPEPQSALFGAASEPARVAPPTATTQDVMAAMQRYAQKFDGTSDLHTAKHLRVDCAALSNQMFGRPTIPQSDPVALGKMVAALDKATAENPFARAVVG